MTPTLWIVYGQKLALCLHISGHGACVYVHGGVCICVCMCVCVCVGMTLCVCMYTYVTCNHCSLGRIKGTGYTTTGIIGAEETIVRQGGANPDVSQSTDKASNRR